MGQWARAPPSACLTEMHRRSYTWDSSKLQDETPGSVAGRTMGAHHVSVAELYWGMAQSEPIYLQDGAVCPLSLTAQLDVRWIQHGRLRRHRFRLHCPHLTRQNQSIERGADEATSGLPAVCPGFSKESLMFVFRAEVGQCRG